MNDDDSQNEPTERRRVQIVSRAESHFQSLVSVVGAVLSAILLHMVIGNNNLTNRLDERLMNTLKNQEQRGEAVDQKLEKLGEHLEELQKQNDQYQRRFYQTDQAEALISRITERLSRLETKIQSMEDRYVRQSQPRQ